MREDQRKKYLDPRWQKKRLEILSRDDFKCQACNDSKSTLHVHHRLYLNKPDGGQWRDPWEYADSALVTLCDKCHAYETEMMPTVIHDFILVVKEHLLADDIHDLTGAILGRGFPDLPAGVVFAAVCHALKDEGAQLRLIEDYVASRRVCDAKEASAGT